MRRPSLLREGLPGLVIAGALIFAYTEQRPQSGVIVRTVANGEQTAGYVRITKPRLHSTLAGGDDPRPGARGAPRVGDGPLPARQAPPRVAPASISQRPWPQSLRRSVDAHGRSDRHQAREPPHVGVAHPDAAVGDPARDQVGPVRAVDAHEPARRPSTSSRGDSPRLGAPMTRISRPSGPAS